VLVVLVSVLVLMGAASLYRIIKHNQELATLEWPTCEGNIIESRGEEGRHAKGHGFLPVVVYEYRVNDTEFVSRRIRPYVDNLVAQEQFEQLLQRYPPGGRVSVHYHPEQPEISCLLPGPTEEEGLLYYMSIGGLILSASCGAAWLLFPRRFTLTLAKAIRSVRPRT